MIQDNYLIDDNNHYDNFMDDKDDDNEVRPKYYTGQRFCKWVKIILTMFFSLLRPQPSPSTDYN